MTKKRVSVFLLIILLLMVSCTVPHTQNSSDNSGSTSFISRKGLIKPQPETINLNADSNLTILENTNIPINDEYDAAAKYRQISIDRNAAAHERVDYVTGDMREFFVLDVDTNVYETVSASLAYVTPHLYFWIQQDVEYELSEVAELCETFENEIYPLNREYFGSEKTPGIDNDEHLFILLTNKMGLASGYFSSADGNPREIEPYSNEADIFMLSSVYTRLDEEYTYGVLAHEFQHMIHRNLDSNEYAWINEGFSELASYINGYDPGGTDALYVGNPDIQLNFWPRDEVESTLPHYGASFLFMTYLNDRFGEDFSKVVVANPLNGFASIDAVLADLKGNDAGNSESLSGNDVFQDWSIANLLTDPTLDEGQYGYKNLPNELTVRVDPIGECSAGEYTFSVRQFGVDYYQFLCSSPFHLQFKGQPTTAIVPADPHSGDYYFWSNKGDQSAMTLTQTFNFQDVSAPITLSYYTWYDLEEDWDYVYVLAQKKGSEWQVLNPPGCTEENITGSNQGCGYNGSSTGWIREEVDLSQFAGEEVTLQFEYLTDTALNGEGFLIDDIQIDAIGYSTDLEDSNGGWVGNGFVRISNSLPQTYAVTVIEKTAAETTLTKYQFAGQEALNIYVDPGKDADIFLIVSGTTRYTIMESDYSLSLQSHE